MRNQADCQVVAPNMEDAESNAGSGSILLRSPVLVDLGQRAGPGFEAGGEVLDEVGLLWSEIVTLAGIVEEVVKLDLAACTVREVELPVLPAQGGIGFLGVHFPKQRLRADVDAAEESCMDSSTSPPCFRTVANFSRW